MGWHKYLLGVFLWGILSCHVARGRVEGAAFRRPVSRLVTFVRSGVLSRRGALNAGCNAINLGVEYIKIG